MGDRQDRTGKAGTEVEGDWFNKSLALLIVLFLFSLFPARADGDVVEVVVIGNAVPDYSFFFYDPSLRYRLMEYPSWAETWTREEAMRWANVQRASGNLYPADFIIELPYNSYGSRVLDSTIRSLCEGSIKSRNAGLFLASPQTSLLADLAPDQTRVDVEPGTHPTWLVKQNWDILRGKIYTEYSLTNPIYPLSPFDGIFTEYHDANLFIMEEVHPLAEVMVQIQTKGSMTSILGETRPWMLRVNMSDLPAGDNLNAVGYAFFTCQ